MADQPKQDQDPQQSQDRQQSQDQEIESTAPTDEAKARFREALERKRASQHRSAEGRRNTGVVHGSEPGAGRSRTFRRKTG